MKKVILLFAVFFLGGCATHHQMPESPQSQWQQQEKEIAVMSAALVKIVKKIEKIEKERPRLSFSEKKKIKAEVKRTKIEKISSDLPFAQLQNRVGLLEEKVEFLHPDTEILTEETGFSPGQYKLTKRDKKKLKAIKKKIQDGYKVVKIIGIADPYGGNAKKNLKLARQRAQEVAQFLGQAAQRAEIEEKIYRKRFTSNRRWIVILKK